MFTIYEENKGGFRPHLPRVTVVRLCHPELDENFSLALSVISAPN